MLRAKRLSPLVFRFFMMLNRPALNRSQPDFARLAHTTFADINQAPIPLKAKLGALLA
jgi:hypothetical protein